VHFYLAHGAATKLEHARDCSGRQVRPYLFLAAGRLRHSEFSQEISESNYLISTTSVVVSRSLRQHFACHQM